MNEIAQTKIMLYLWIW